ncbi:MAG: hypothetical protein OHK0013_22210 [Sandaracinaceae bacterium]
MIVMTGAATSIGACGGGTAYVETTEVVVAETQASPLLIGGQVSNYGQVQLDTGFLPDPHQVAVVSGASNATGNVVDINALALTPRNGGACRGYTTTQPDYIVRVGRPGQLLRFWVNAPGDTTLIINDGAGNWWCSDDDGGNLNPLIEMQAPVAGQYDIWVGSYQAGANIQSVLSVSELPGTGP